MDHIFKLNATLINNDETCDVKMSANGEINLIGKTYLLTEIFKALHLNPDNPVDMAAIMVAIDKYKEE